MSMISAFYVLLEESFLLPRSLICSPVLSLEIIIFLPLILRSLIFLELWWVWCQIDGKGLVIPL